MSFQNGFCVPSGSGHLSDVDMASENSSRVEQRRVHQWLVDDSEKVFLPNKRQAIQSAADSRPIPGAAYVNSLLGSGSSYQSVKGEASTHLSGSDQPLKIFNIRDKNVLPLSDENMSVGRREFGNSFHNDSLVNLSLSHSRKDLGVLNVGAREVRGSQIHLQSVYQCSHKRASGSGHATSLGLSFTGEVENFAPSGWNFSRRSDEFNLMGYHCRICDEKFKSTGPAYNNVVHEKLVALGGSHMQAKENFTSSSSAIFASGVPIYPKLDVAAASKGITYDPYDKENSCFLSLGRGSGKGKEAIVSMVGNYPKGNLIIKNNFLGSLSSAEGSNVLTEKSTRWSSADQVMNVAPRKTDAVLKPKRAYARKVSPYCFPTNVKNLLSTGIFEGVPVKYVSWSRGKTLKGIIKGTNYLCGCDRCKMKKKVNAYEFEQHAGCDTKHPNNHIYFPSGKSLYSVVQKLKGIRNELLYDAIKTASGTPINIKNFRAWKALYESTSYSFRRIH